MYRVRAYASHADRESGRTALSFTFDRRGDAMDYADALGLPIVDTIDIGAAGSCPAGGGHTFDASGRCTACRAEDAELYVPGTYLPRSADNPEPLPAI